MSIRRASKTFRLPLFSTSYKLLGLASVLTLALYCTPQAAATTYHASSGHCQNNNPGSDVSWNFVLNPTTSTPSTLIGTSNYSVEFAQGVCYWSAFAPAGTLASATSKIEVKYTTIYNSQDNGPNPAGKAEIFGGTSTAPGQYGTFLYHAPSNPQTNLTTSGTEDFPVTTGNDLSKVVVEDLVGSGNQFTSSMELDITSISIIN